MINVDSIYVAAIITALYLPRIIHFLILGKNKISTRLFSLPRILLFFLIIILGIGSTILALFFSHSFAYNGFFFLFTGATIVFAGAYMILYFVFFSHGYDPRYLFMVGKLPCPFIIVSGIVYLLAALLTTNYYLLLCVSAYLLVAFIFDYLGCKETKPKINLDLPVPPDEF